MMKKVLGTFLCGIFLLIGMVGCSSAVDPVDAETSSGGETGISFDFEAREGDIVAACYDDGSATVSELLDKATLIVRATPVAVESETAVASCWVLRVDEADRAGVTEIRLRQLKDEYLLKQGEEVVLALCPVEGSYYYISGGGSGLFRPSRTISGMSGELLPDLIARSGEKRAAGELTAADVYRMLTSL